MLKLGRAVRITTSFGRCLAVDPLHEISGDPSATAWAQEMLRIKLSLSMLELPTLRKHEGASEVEEPSQPCVHRVPSWQSAEWEEPNSLVLPIQ